MLLLGITQLTIPLVKISRYVEILHDIFGTDSYFIMMFFQLKFTPCRNQLSSLLLSSKEWKAAHTAIRCVVFDPPGRPIMEVQNSAYEILGSAMVSCYASCTSKLKFSFPTCRDQYMHGAQAIQQMQK